MQRGLRSASLIFLVCALVLVGATGFFLRGQNQQDFPSGFDAVQAAPSSHKVLFENALVRVIEVDLPKPGDTVPLHHHRWPSLVIEWDTGGGAPHIRYHRPGQPVRDIPAATGPSHAGKWSLHWMPPEPMHSIEVVAWPDDAAAHASDPPELRVEFKTHP